MSLINPDLSGIVDGAVGDAADWTTPMNTIINAINGGLDTDNFSAGGTNLGTIAQGVAWTTYSPTVTASGSMTISGTVTNVARYQQIGKWVAYRVDFSNITFGGSASNTILVTLPVTAKDTFSSAGAGFVSDGGGTAAAFSFFNSTGQIGLRKYQSGLFSLGGSGAASVSGIYEAA